MTQWYVLQLYMATLQENWAISDRQIRRKSVAKTCFRRNTDGIRPVVKSPVGKFYRRNTDGICNGFPTDTFSDGLPTDTPYRRITDGNRYRRITDGLPTEIFTDGLPTYFHTFSWQTFPSLLRRKNDFFKKKIKKYNKIPVFFHINSESKVKCEYTKN